MNKTNKVFTSILLSSITAVALVLAIDANSGSFHSGRKVAASAGPITEIDSVSFYKNNAVKTAYGNSVGDGRFSDYQINKTFSMSGGDWVVSAGAYGEDNPTHLQDAGRHETLFFSSIFDTNIRDSYSIYASTLDAFGDYKDDFSAIISEYPGVFSMVIMSTTTFANVKDFGFFWHYATHNPEASRPAMGVLPLYKIEGETTWNRTYSDGLSWADGKIVYPDANVVSGNATVSTTDMIDFAGPYTRYYDGGYIFNNTPYVGVPTDKNVQLAFFVFGDWTNYFIDIQLDGIVVNRHETAMKFMNGLNSKTICSGGTIDDENITKSFELLDKCFDSAYVGDGTDTADLKNYSINHELYPNLRENNYYSQYQYLKSKLV